MSKISDTQLIKHLSHIDELIYSVPADRLELVEFCRNVIDLVNGEIESNKITEMTTKIDGSVSVVFGRHPTSNKFFVGSKSVFNKTPKINYSVDDIYLNHNKNVGLCKTLIYIFNVLSKYVWENCYQGDLIFTENDLKDNGDKVEFTPNTLTYSIDKSQLKGKKLGLSVHTIYRQIAKPIDDVSLLHMKANQLLSKPKEIANAHDVYLVKTATDINSILKTEKMRLVFYTRELEKEYQRLKISVKSLKSDEFANLVIHMNRELVMYSNQCIRNQSEHNYLGFLNFVKTRWIAKGGELDRLELLGEYQSSFNTLFAIQETLTRFKSLLINLFAHGKHEFQTKYKDTDTGHEGYVFKFGERLLKLVNRLEFSKHNFDVNANR